MFDILYSAIHLFNGVQDPSLPGLIILTAPRNAARGREGDILFGYYHVSNAAADESSKEQEWLNQTAGLFFKTPGTVTSGMRQVIEKINAELMLRNLDRTREGSRINASFGLAVLHHGNLFYTTLGSLRTFVITKNQTIDNQENELASRGLGISQNIDPRFQQMELQANDLVIFTPAAPLSWTAATLAGSADLSVEALRRRLSNQAGPELKAGLFRFVEGKGKALPLNLRFAAEQVIAEPTTSQETINAPVPTAPVSAVADTVQVEEAPHLEPLAVQPSDKLENAPVVPAVSPVMKSGTAIANGTPVRLRQETPIVSSENEVHLRQAGEKSEASPRQKAAHATQSFARATAGTISRMNTVSSTVRSWTGKLLHQTLPEGGEAQGRLSTPTMLLISILVPLLVIAIGASFYDRMGRSQEFESALIKAEQFNTQADTQKSDAVSRLASLQQAMYWLDQAGRYGSSSDYGTLRNQVQSNLDELNGIQRLAFSPAIDPVLDANVRISQMVATSTDLYLLDSTSGKVFRYFYAGSIFQKDNSFDCGPNASPLGNSIGPIVDIVALPSGNELGATLLAIDGAGTLEYCLPSETGMVNAGLSVPDAGWGKIQSIALSQGTLFVLDPAMNAVYRYEGNGVEFPDKPVLYFDDQIPPLGEAIDIEVNADELYILRSSGDLVECTYSALKALKATECQDPAPYGDMRTGQTPQAVSFPDVNFIQMHMTNAPDSSLYMLDAKGKTIYHFSLQRNLQKVFLPSFTDNAVNKLESTAFAVSPGRLIFVAFQNVVEFTQLP